MAYKRILCAGSLAFLVVLVGCDQTPNSSSLTPSQPQSVSLDKPVQDSSELKLYDLRMEDITRLRTITSLNLLVLGVKVGDRTVDVNKNKRLGKPIKTELINMGKTYRTTYQNSAIHVDFDKYTGKVTAIYVNSSFFRKIKGRFANAIKQGNIDLVNEILGDTPLRTQPERHTTRWTYPDKGIELIRTKQPNRVNFTLKLVKPENT